MAIINRLPKGLLDFLDQQTQGRNPQEPAPGLVLTSDITAHYRTQSLKANANTEVVDTSTALLLVSTGVSTLQVPEGEVWELLAMHGRLTLGAVPAATVTVTLSLSLLIPGIAPIVSANAFVASGTVDFRAASPVSASRSVEWQPPQRLILNPGTVLQVNITEFEVGIVGFGAPNLAVVAAFYPWRI